MEIKKMCEVRFTKFADKQVARLPEYIQEKLDHWVDAIEKNGLFAMREVTGFNDEPLKGARSGERSSRLNRAYRVIYEVDNSDGELVIIAVLEVNKHDY